MLAEWFLYGAAFLLTLATLGMVVHAYRSVTQRGVEQ